MTGPAPKRDMTGSPGRRGSKMENERVGTVEPVTEEVVRGIVIPTLWDKQGNPLRVSILTADEGEFPVSPRGLGRRLFSFLTEEVKVRGTAEEGDSGSRLFRVLSFTVIQNGPGEAPDAVPVRSGRRLRSTPSAG